MKVRLWKGAGPVKEVKTGFSWTMLFFGGFVPLLRGDPKWLLIWMVACPLTFGIAGFIFPFIYNKSYIKGLLASGYVVADESSKTLMQSKGLVI